MTLLHLAQPPAGVTALPSQKDEKEVLSFPNHTLSTQKQEQRDLFTPAEGGADAQETKGVRGAVGAGQGDQARGVPCCRAPGSSAPPSTFPSTFAAFLYVRLFNQFLNLGSIRRSCLFLEGCRGVERRVLLTQRGADRAGGRQVRVSQPETCFEALWTSEGGSRLMPAPSCGHVTAVQRACGVTGDTVAFGATGKTVTDAPAPRPRPLGASALLVHSPKRAPPLPPG